MTEHPPSTINGIPLPYNKTTEELLTLIKQGGSEKWKYYYPLATKSDPQAQAALLAATCSSDWTDRRTAIEIIGLYTSNAKIDSIVVQVLENDKSEYVVRTALKVIAARKIRAAHSKVTKLLTTKNRTTVEEAVRTLRSIYEEEDLEKLLNIFRADRTEKKHLRKEVGWTLRQNASQTNWKILFEEWGNDTLHRHRLWACEIARDYGNDNVLPSLRKLEVDQDGLVRRAASQALHAIQCRQPKK